jgi:hypothetical protein
MPGGLTIIPAFDSSITTDPQAATIQATINSAIAVYQNTFSDPVTVSITFMKLSTGLGSSATAPQPFLYSDYRANLVLHVCILRVAIEHQAAGCHHRREELLRP